MEEGDISNLRNVEAIVDAEGTLDQEQLTKEKTRRYLFKCYTDNKS